MLTATVVGIKGYRTVSAVSSTISDEYFPLVPSCFPLSLSLTAVLRNPATGNSITAPKKKAVKVKRKDSGRLVSPLKRRSATPAAIPKLPAVVVAMPTIALQDPGRPNKQCALQRKFIAAFGAVGNEAERAFLSLWD